MTTMPIRSMKPPSAIAGQPNGAVNPALLARIDRDGYLWQFAALPARGMRALRHDLKRDTGHDLDTTGRGRTLSMQWDIFGGAHARYRPCSLAEYTTNKALNQELTKDWPAAERHAVAALLGVTIPESEWWTKVTLAGGGHPATAAVPGTSPHGLWCADDIAEPDGSDLGTEVDNLSDVVFAWLCAHALDYGFAGSTLSEKWHWQWYLGDLVPPAVLAYEASLSPKDTDMPKLAKCSRETAPQPDIDDGGATFSVTGITMKWINNMDDLAVARAHGVVPPESTPIEFWALADFKSFTLFGSLPPGFTEAHFREHIT